MSTCFRLAALDLGLCAALCEKASAERMVSKAWKFWVTRDKLRGRGDAQPLNEP